MKTRNRLTAVALAAACANGAFAMDVAGFEFNGYSRGGPVFNHSDGVKGNLTLGGELQKYRLGNEGDNGIEVNFAKGFEAGGINWKVNYMPAKWGSGDISTAQAFVEMSGFSFSPEAKFWVGQRRLRIQDVHIVDNFLLNYGDNIGAGVTDVPVGGMKLGVGVFSGDKFDGGLPNNVKAHRINAPGMPIEDMDAHLKLDAGVLQLVPLNFGVAGGDIRSTIRMDAREKVIHTNARISARRLDLSKLFPEVKLTRDAVGRISGDFALAGTGNSIAAMLGSADGGIALGMGRGQISNLLMELAGIDIAEALKFLVTKDRKVPIRCAFGDFSVDNGLMQSRALAFDTADTIIVGSGKISLKDETLDLELRPRPKDRSILALRSPLVVGGSFKDPSFHPDFKRLGLRGAVALVLGNIAPPAALLATLELGPGKDSSCGGKYAK